MLYGSDGRSLSSYRRCGDIDLGRVVASSDEVGGKYCEDCRVAEPLPTDSPVSAISRGVRGYVLDPESAKALWKRSEEMVSETLA